MKHLLRTRLAKDIVCEVAFPAKQTGKVALVCGGAPGSPSKKDVLLFLASKGYVALAMRYRGTWESEGSFLEQTPTKDVTDVIDYLSKHKSIIDAWSSQKTLIKIKYIDLFGISFSGPAVLFNSKHAKVRKVLALAPALNWNARSLEYPFDSFVHFSQVGFGGAYRVRNQKNWNKLLRSDFYNPLTMADQIDAKKCFIIQALDDGVCLPEDTKALQELIPIHVYYKPKGGHLGSMNITQKFYWKKIQSFLRR